MSGTATGSARPGDGLLRRGRLLEVATLGWNVVGIVVLAVAAVSARSVALAGFGLDSLIEIGASTVVLWELAGTSEHRQRRALRLIGGAFAALAVYLAVQSTWTLASGFHPRHSPLGIAWTAVTAVVMFALAAGKARTGRALNNPVLLHRMPMATSCRSYARSQGRRGCRNRRGSYHRKGTRPQPSGWGRVASCTRMCAVYLH